MTRARNRREKLVALAYAKGMPDGFRIESFEPRPKRPKRLVVKSDAAFEAQLARDMERVWQTHEATATWPAYRAQWPNRAAFKANWPLLAFDLVVADWKVRRAGSQLESEEIPAEILDPPPAPDREPWQARYAEEIAQHSSLGWALQQSLGAVFRRAKLSPTYAVALRMWLEGESDVAIAKAIRRQARFVPDIRMAALKSIKDAFGLAPMALKEGAA